MQVQSFRTWNTLIRTWIFAIVASWALLALIWILWEQHARLHDPYKDKNATSCEKVFACQEILTSDSHACFDTKKPSKTTMVTTVPLIMAFRTLLGLIGMSFCLHFKASIFGSLIKRPNQSRFGPFRGLKNPCRYSHSGPEFPNPALDIHIELLIELPWSHMNSSVAFIKWTHPWGHKNEALLEKVCVWLDFWTRKKRSTIRPSKT